MAVILISGDENAGQVCDLPVPGRSSPLRVQFSAAPGPSYVGEVAACNLNADKLIVGEDGSGATWVPTPGAGGWVGYQVSADWSFNVATGALTRLTSTAPSTFWHLALAIGSRFVAANTRIVGLGIDINGTLLGNTFSRLPSVVDERGVAPGATANPSLTSLLIADIQQGDVITPAFLNQETNGWTITTANFTLMRVA